MAAAAAIATTTTTHTKHNGDAGEECECENESCELDDSSVDTQDAFMEMLGMSASPPSSLDVMDDVVVVAAATTTTTTKNEDMKHSLNAKMGICPNSTSTPNSTTCINLPPKCSRHHLKPSSCLALTVDNVLSMEQCQHLIEMAGGAGGGAGNRNGFRYITEATHKAPDGTSYTVKLQNPNPHKLSAIDTSHNGNGNSNSNSNVGNNTCTSTSIMDQLYATISNVLYSHPSFETFANRTKCGPMQWLNPRMRILRYDAHDNDRFEAHFDATTFVPATALTRISTHMQGEHDHEHDHDGSFEIRNKQQRRKSLITVLVYLNDGNGGEFQGGETLYLDYHNSASSMSMSKSTRNRHRHHHGTNGNGNGNDYGNDNGNDIDNGVVKVVPKVGRVVLFEHDLFHSGAPLEWGTKFIMRTDVLFNEEGTKSDCFVNAHHVDGGELVKCSDGSGSGADNGQTTVHTRNTDANANANPNPNTTSTTSMLVSDICNELHLTDGVLHILEEMDLLHITCESFISPGMTLLKRMLVDGGMDDETVRTLVHGTMKAVS